MIKILDPVKKFLGLDVEKRANGVFISRPVLNADEWAAWSAKWGIPSPLGAADLHVTVVSSAVDVKMKPASNPIVVDMCRACFCLMGPENQALAVSFWDWQLQDRFWDLQSNGAVSDWPTYRPHMTLTMAAGDFELSDEALADAPDYIVLGGEVNADRKTADATPDDMDPEGLGEDEGDDDGDEGTVIVIQVAASAAKAFLDSEAAKALNPIDASAVYDVAKSRKISAGVAKRLAAAPWAPAEFKDLIKAEKTAAQAETRKRVETDVVLRMTPAGSEAVKKSRHKEVLKAVEEQQIIYAISNVYSIGGKLVEDLDGESFTTRAMEEFTAQVLKRDTSGTWEHEGEPRNIVVQGLVLSDEVQKALGIDLGYECLVTATHFPDPEDWAKAKSGDWEQSIAGRFWYYEDE